MDFCEDNFSTFLELVRPNMADIQLEEEMGLFIGDLISVCSRSCCGFSSTKTKENKITANFKKKRNTDSSRTKQFTEATSDFCPCFEATCKKLGFDVNTTHNWTDGRQKPWSGCIMCHKRALLIMCGLDQHLYHM